MSDHANVKPLRTAPTVPDFQNQSQPEPAPQPSIADAVLEQVIARTVQTMEARALRPSPFKLDTFEDIENFAERLAKSELCPKDYKRKPDDIIIAVMLGKEVGLPAMASVQSIAVINGRPSLWGEAVPGLCMATGQVVDVTERFEGDELSDDYTAVCTVTRRGYSPREGRFSARDRKRAGIGSVHNSYPKDMLMWRARHRAWHGVFPDILRGLGTAEIDAEEGNRPRWILPRPERTDAARNAKAEGDTWNDSWFDGAAKGLFEEQDPWRWLELLQTLLKQAPTLRDVKEIESLNSVVRALASAPEEAKTTIAQAFVEADARLGKPPLAEAQPQTDAKPKRERRKPAAARTEAPVQQAEPPPAESTQAPSEAQSEGVEGAAFEYAVLDSAGEPIDGEFHTDPLAWAEAFSSAINPGGYEAACEHNADAIADARLDAEAASILDDMAREHAEQQEAHRTVAEPPPVIEPTVVRGKPDWPQYIRDLTAALQAETAESLGEFVEAQRARAATFPASTRLQATRAIVDRAQALGITPPAGFAGATETAETGPAAPPADQPPPKDKDRALLDSIIEHLTTLTNIHAVQSYSNQATNRTLLERWTREEKAALATEMTTAFQRRLGEIQRGEI